jgi:site-specific DNA recombinase
VLNDNTLTINPEKAENVKIIYQKYLDGNTMERIARSLKGEASPGTLTVREILKDPVYAGYIFKGQDVIKGSHEPIIDSKTFNSVQIKIVRNIRNPKYVYEPLHLQG